MLSEKLVRARESRGWTINEAARRTGVVHHHALTKLETNQTDPARTSIETALALIWLYDGDITLSDFVDWADGEFGPLKVLRKRGRKPKGMTRDERNRPDRRPARVLRGDRAQDQA